MSHVYIGNVTTLSVYLSLKRDSVRARDARVFNVQLGLIKDVAARRVGGCASEQVLAEICLREAAVRGNPSFRAHDGAMR